MSSSSSTAHPRIHERRIAVEDQSLRSRNRKLIAFGILVLLGLIAFAATQSALLDVDEVRVIGAERTSPNAVRSFAAVEPGVPLIGLDHSAIKQRLLAAPAIADATSSHDWSGVVTIEIVERLPVARFGSDEGMIIAAADGVVLEVVDEPRAELPLVSGAIFTSSAGERVPSEVDEALAVAAALPDDVLTVTDAVELSIDALSLRLVGGAVVLLGDGRELDVKIDAVRAILAQVELRCLAELNVRAPLVPVIVRTESCA